jgi:hypothetical protein
MLAVIMAAGQSPGLEALNQRHPTPLLPLMDRPFIQHVVEFLVQQGITHFDFVLSHLPEKIEHFLGDGSRWGSVFRYHLTKDPLRPYEDLNTLRLEGRQEPILLATGDRMPQVDLTQGDRSLDIPLAFCLENGNQDFTGPDKWSGWALLPAFFFSQAAPSGTEEEMAHQVLAACPEGPSQKLVSTTLDIRSYAGLIQAHRMVLDKEFEGLLLGGRETDPGIWISRNVSLHPTAKLTPPVYIGEGTRIGAGTQLGPHAVIGNNCILDSGSSVARSVIFRGGYVGEALEIADVIVDKNRLINVRLGTAVSIADRFILGSLLIRPLRQRMLSLLSRITGIVFLLILWPVILGTALFLKIFRKGPVRDIREVIFIPASSDPALWRTFSYWTFLPPKAEEAREVGRLRTAFREVFLRAIPSLIPVALGRMRIVGVSPRSREEVLGLSDDWRALYLHTHAGIVSEALVHYGADPTEDELYSAQAFYSAMSGFNHDLKLLWGYVARLLGFGID